MYFFFVSIFGEAMVLKKKYLHNVQHVHITEGMALNYGLATAESYEMQGREHANKIFGREYKQKYDGVVETKKKVLTLS